MRGTTINKGSIRTLALLGVLAAVGIGYAGAASVTASAKTDTPSVWATASEAASPDQTPTLTNGVGQPESGGAGWELALGLALIGVSLLAFAYGIAAVVRQRNGAHKPPDAHTNARLLTADPPVRTQARR